MKTTDRAIIFVVGGLVLAIAFYFMLLSPKRQEAADLDKQVSDLEASISQQEQVALFAEDARKQFPSYYGRLVVLGKAVPEDADTASMLVQLNSLAGRSDVDFIGISLSQGATGTGTSTAAPAPTPAPEAPAPGAPAPAAEGTAPEGSTATPAAAPAGDTGTAPADAAATGTAPAPATEASAANLPIGAVVGPAGLPTLPYELDFTGGYFGVADFIGGLDSLVTVREKSGQVAADGRLMTVDGFSLKVSGPGPSPSLDASFLLTSYVTPAEQGLTAGATPTGPAPAATGVPPTTPASTGTVAP